MNEVTAIKCFATGTIFKIRRDSSCQMENMIYIAYCLNCQKQGVSSAVSWKPRLRNYNSHIKNNVKGYKTVRNFIKECKRVSNLCLILVDVLNNVDHFSSDETEDWLLQKEQKICIYLSIYLSINLCIYRPRFLATGCYILSVKIIKLWLLAGRTIL